MPERERRGAEDVVGAHLVAAVQRGGRACTLDDRDVGAVAVRPSQDDPRDRAVELVWNANCRQLLLCGGNRRCELRLCVCPLGTERLGVGRERAPPADHLRPGRRVLERVDLDLEADPVGDLRPQLALLLVHRPDEQESRGVRDRARPRARRR